MEPPALSTCPSSVTMRKLLLYISRNAYGVIQRVDNCNAAQQIFINTRVFVVIPDQVDGKSLKAGSPSSPLISSTLPRTVEIGRNVARPPSRRFKKLMASLPSSSCRQRCAAWRRPGLFPRRRHIYRPF